jgi:hypothetical protein
MVVPMDWRVARSLDTLRLQVNRVWPQRSVASDGLVGDSQHDVTSDHWPRLVPGMGATPVVLARDITHDVDVGADCSQLAEWLRLGRDDRLKYVIFNRRMFSSYPKPGVAPAWAWRPYTGTNPHTHHLHISVVSGVAADDPHPWRLGEDSVSINNTDFVALWTRVEALTTGAASVRVGPVEGEPVVPTMLLRDISSKLDALTAGVVNYEVLAGALAPYLEAAVEHAIARMRVTVDPSI